MRNEREGRRKQREPARQRPKPARQRPEPARQHPDPRAELSPTARKLVAAARRLLKKGGFEALTVETVAAEAGAYRDSVRYYFGSKAAFMATVVDSLAHDQSLESAERTRDLPSGTERVKALVEADLALAADRDSFRDFFTIFPHVLLDRELRLRVASLYDWYRELYVRALEDGDREGTARLRRYASLMAAVTDGLAVQKLLDPEDVDLDELFGLWAEMLQRSLDRDDGG